MTNRSTFHDINFTGSLLQNGSAFAGSPWTVSGDHLTYTTGSVAVGTNASTNTSQAKHTVQGISRITNGTQNVDMQAIAGSGLFTNGVDLTPSDGQTSDGFGVGCSISGDGKYIAIGSFQENSDRQGAAYVYYNDGGGTGYQQQAKLTESPRTNNSKFAEQLAINDDGTTLAINSCNRAEIWVRSGTSWSRQAALGHATGLVGNLDNGIDLSGDGNTCIYGAGKEHSNGLSDNGVVRISVRSGTSWSQQALLTASDRATNASFGTSCALSKDGNTAIIGANRANGNKGQGYIFVRSGTSWSQQAILSNSAWFYAGFSVAISSDGNTAAIGIYGHYRGGSTFGIGMVSVFTRSGTSWSQQAELVDPVNTSAFEAFGLGMDMSADGNTIAVGSPADAQGGTNTGSLNVFTRSGTSWSHTQQLRGNNPLANKQLGIAVKLDDAAETLVVSVPDAVLFSPTGANGPGRVEVMQAATKFLNLNSLILANGNQLSFTGQHLCFPEGPMERGLVVSANRNKFMNLNGPLTTGLAAIKSSESLPVVSLSNVVNDSTVFGVVDSVETLQLDRSHSYGKCLVRSEKEWGDNRAIINSLGEGAIWVVNTNGNISSGEYITTSNIIGYGHKQDDDILHSYTVAKITMDCNFNPEDIPIQVIKKDENGNNIIDQYDRLQWEDTDETQKMYDIKYLTVDGGLTDQANSVWTAAYVGCTYHCG
tara:strand:+ start:87 stop:2210 length:2124 start_codon:yes stop_codon:yes gene_type:complete